MRKNTLTILKALLALVLLNILSHYLYKRFDLTEDARYTLTPQSLSMARGLEGVVSIDILLGGDLPPEFQKLRTETALLLQGFQEENKNIRIDFVDPMEGAESQEAVMADLQRLGLTPVNSTVERNGEMTQKILFPWAMVNRNNTTIKVPLLKNKLGATMEERVNNSVQHLEYAFADAFYKLNIKDRKRLAVIKGNGELADLYLADFLTGIRDYYNIGAITLDSVATDPQGTLDQLKEFDLALVAKPTEAFTDAEKYVMDQFVVSGGKSLWLIDAVAMELDSLFNEKGSALATPRDLNLNDFFFRYGVRINPVLVSDLYFTQIVLAAGEGNNTAYNPVPWFYNPMVFSKNDHPINTNLEALRFQFANSIDTLPNANRKTVLYQSSPLSKTEGTPRLISLDIINTPPKKETYTNGNQPLAVLIEGDFTSAYTNRIKPLQLEQPIEKGASNKMLVIADGDLIGNQVRNGRPLELGYDKWTNNFYGNKEFLVNAVNYLLDDKGLINIRNKRVAIPFLDERKVAGEKSKWQLINIGLPIVLIVAFGFLFGRYRRQKYGR
ncbi:MAG: gliding motility-associated ABC transporter substrate-binding protein GldG [Sediminicola sp.]|tara:strand:+ start:32465 stop:34129 length:1665 start_codon:yes stop_codon:yes gene_type:complete